MPRYDLLVRSRLVFPRPLLLTSATMMIRRIQCVGCYLSITLTAMVAGCWNQQAPRLPPPTIAPNAAQTAVETYAAGKTVLEPRVLEQTPALKAALAGVARDSQGNIAPQGIQERIEAWRKSMTNRMSVRCIVKHGGRPLPGAKVTFTPEVFLGPDFKPGSGVSDQFGIATITPNDGGFPGMPPGFYRIQVTKDGEPIPARYNTATVLGHEVAVDAADMRTGIELKLEY
jgi:hypothetical protein